MLSEDDELAQPTVGIAGVRVKLQDFGKLFPLSILPGADNRPCAFDKLSKDANLVFEFFDGLRGGRLVNELLFQLLLLLRVEVVPRASDYSRSDGFFIPTTQETLLDRAIREPINELNAPSPNRNSRNGMGVGSIPSRDIPGVISSSFIGLLSIRVEGLMNACSQILIRNQRNPGYFQIMAVGLLQEGHDHEDYFAPQSVPDDPSGDAGLLKVS